ncbi:MAG: DNA adenine methylase [Proteobacteria bacterium]|nr:DNA adenine methylase [Pseudomonadota bacterium]
MQSPIRSPLRYPGSKRRLANYVRQTLELNNFRPALYVEPFVGGASVGLQLLQYELIDKVIFMDLDPWVASFWHTVFFDTKWLVEKIRTTRVTLKLWKEIKNSKPRSIRDRAWACFYLNRTSFSGILEAKAGPLGGRKQKSEYKIDCRFPRETLIKRVLQAASFSNKVYAVWNCSWEDGISEIKAEQKRKNLPKKNIFYYLDPPFFEEAQELYRFYFQEKDHTRLRDYLLQFKDNWLLSYDYAKQVEVLYGDAISKKTNGTNHQHVDIYYSLAILSERRVAKEVILSNLPKLPA